jgi:RNA polymerase sigma-70 factor (ECF subfamily)
LIFALALGFLKPIVLTAPDTVSTDDAHVDGHGAIVAPRVAGQVPPTCGPRSGPKELSSMRHESLSLLVAMIVISILDIAAAPGGPDGLKYGDGQAEGKRSLGGSGEMIEFTLPDDGAKVAGLKVHGSRYGTPAPPDESFLIYFLNEDLSGIVATQMAPYSLFERGPERWVEVTFYRPVEVPKRFWVALDFRPHQTKGVYVSYDTSTTGAHSRIGLPGMKARPTNFGGDWMIEVVLAK